jgi:hypothetical protein
MRTPKQPPTFDRWIAIGKEMKAIQHRLLELGCDHELQSVMTKKELESLVRASHYGSKFKDRGEEAMYRQIAPTYPGNKHDLLDVFYGGDFKELHPQSEGPQ